MVIKRFQTGDLHASQDRFRYTPLETGTVIEYRAMLAETSVEYDVHYLGDRPHGHKDISDGRSAGIAR